MKLCTTTKPTRIVSLSLLVLTTVGIGFFLIVSPKNTDDYWFAISFKDWLGKYGIRDIDCGWKLLETGWPIREIINTWVYHITMDCGRVSNLVMMFFLFLPKWVGSSVAWLVWVVGMYYSLRLAKVNLTRSPWLVAVAVFCWSFQINWTDNMGCLAFQYNYPLVSGLMLWYIWWVKCDNTNAGLGRLLAIFAIGLIVGAWHEGFTVPLIVGGLAIVVLFQRFRRKEIFIALAALAVGLIFLALCPGFSKRADGQVAVMRGSLIHFIGMFISHAVFLISALWILIRCIRRRTVRVSPLLLFAFVSGGVSFLLQIFAGGVRRIGWWCDFISIVALLDLLRTTSFNHSGRFKIIKAFIVIMLGGLSLAHWVLVGYYVIKTRKAYLEERKTLQVDGADWVFVDFVPNTKLPMICMWTPDDALFVSGSGIVFITGFYLEDVETREICIIPANLRNIDSTSGVELPGNTGVRVLDGVMFCDASKMAPTHYWRYGWVIADMKMSIGLGGQCKLRAYSFRSEKDGKEYYYLRPVEDNIKVLIGDIVYLTNIRAHSTL